MNRGASVFLRAVLVLVGVGALAFLLWQPQVEGRNANATQFEIYFQDPFLAYLYLSSIPFFVGLYHGIQVLGHAGRGTEFSPPAVASLRTIKVCAILLVVLVAGAEGYILFGVSGEDRAGGVMIGVFLAFASIVVATAMAVLERAAQNAVDMKSDNDLTI